MPRELFQQEHVSEPLSKPLCEVSTGSGHEADDEEEIDDRKEREEREEVALSHSADKLITKEFVVRKERSAHELSCNAPLYNVYPDSGGNKTPSGNASDRTAKSDSIDDSYSFSYSDTSSTGTQSTKDTREDSARRR